jgi:mRNA-degrading endonuclease RelE of RelBE toxin-antitoxin system
MERIKAGEEALASGNFVSQGQFEQEMGISTRTMPTRWRLVVSGPARRAILSLPIESSRPKVVDFLTGDLAESPGEVGVELEGQLARRYVASVGDQRVVYRLDPTNRAVRVVDVQRGERVFMGR